MIYLIALGGGGVEDVGVCYQNGSKDVLYWELQRVPYINGRVEPGVPVAYTIVKDEHHNGWFYERGNYLEQYGKVVGAVDAGRFGEAFGHGFYGGAADDAVVDAYGAGQDERPKRVVKAKAPDVQEIRDHPGVKKHGKQNNKQYGFF